MIAAGDGADEFDNRKHEILDPARDGFGAAAQNLAAQSCGICGRCIVGDTAQSEDNNVESSEAAEAGIAGQEKRAE